MIIYELSIILLAEIGMPEGKPTLKRGLKTARKPQMLPDQTKALIFF